MEDKRKNGDEISESNASRRVKALGLDREERDETVIEGDKWENFWYHYKWPTIIVLIFAVIIAITAVQFANKENPDVSIFCCGPNYVSPNQYEKINDALKTIMPDYNEDGRKFIILNGLVYLTEGQIRDLQEKREEAEEAFEFDYIKNNDAAKQFSVQIFSDNSIICILAPDQYESVKREGGFVKLADVFGEMPYCAADEYAIKLSDTRFAKFYSAFDVFPEDTLLVLRTPSLMNGALDSEKAERKYENHKDLFRKIVEYEYPEGYVPEAE